MARSGLRKTLHIGFDEALVRVPEALKAEGFGVLTEVDVRQTLQRKLGVEFRRYRILGACNPSFAHEALQTDLAAGLMMPCNVVVYEDDHGRANVLAVDPIKSAEATGDPRLIELAGSVQEKLERALATLAYGR